MVGSSYKQSSPLQNKQAIVERLVSKKADINKGNIEYLFKVSKDLKIYTLIYTLRPLHEKIVCHQAKQKGAQTQRGSLHGVNDRLSTFLTQYGGKIALAQRSYPELLCALNKPDSLPQNILRFSIRHQMSCVCSPHTIHLSLF